MAPVLPPCPQSPLPMGCPHATISGASLRSGGPGEERWLSREALLHVSQPQEALEQDQQEAGGVLKTPALPRPHLSRSLTLGARQLGPNLWPPGLTGSPITAASPYPPCPSVQLQLDFRHAEELGPLLPVPRVFTAVPRDCTGHSRP